METNESAREPVPGTASPAAGRRVLDVFVWTLVLVPLFFHLFYLPFYGRLQSSDYYGVIRALADGDSFTTDLGTWLDVRTAEHRVAFPAFLWMLNYHLSAGSNRPTAVLSVLILVGIFVLLYRSLPATVRKHAGRRLLFAAPLSLFVFTPLAASNIQASFSGNLNFLADLLAVGAVLVVAAPHSSPLSQGERGTGIWPVAVLGLLGTFTFGTHLGVWPALFAGALLLGRSKRDILVLTVLPLLFASLILLGYEPRQEASDHHVRSFDLLLLLRYAGTYLGSTLSAAVPIARLVGLAGVILSVLIHGALWRVVRDRRRLHLTFAMVQIYAMANAFLVAVARAGGEESQAMAERYALVPSLFWAAFTVSGLLLLDLLSRRRLAVAAVMALWLALAGYSLYERGIPRCNMLAGRGLRQEVVELGMWWSCWEPKLLGTISTRWQGVERAEEILRELGHAPFDREPAAFEATPIDPALLSDLPRGRLFGLATVRFTKHPRALRVFGWTKGKIKGRDVVPAEVIFVDRKHWIRSAVLMNQMRPSMRQKFGLWGLRYGWDGFVFVDPEHLDRVRLRGYVRLEGETTWYPLPGAESLAGLVALERESQKELDGEAPEEE